MTTEMAPGVGELAPPAKRRKRDEFDKAEETLKPGLSNIPDCTLDTVDWCPTVFGALLSDTSSHDVTFMTSDGGRVSAHRLIVAASSPVFQAMLCGNMKESYQKEIEMPSVDSETLSSLLAFLYTGKVDVASQSIEKVLDAAHYFNVAPLEDKLIDFIANSLNLTNIFDIVSFARSSKFTQLYERCLSFMFNHADKVAFNTNFNHLSSEIVLTFCKSSELRINEIKLFLAVNEWCLYQDQLPETVKTRIFQEIRYPLMSETDLINIVRPTEMADPALYTAALEYHLLPDKYRGPSNQIAIRKCPPHDYKFVNMSVIENDNGIQIFKTSKRNGLCAILVYRTQKQPVCFKILLQEVDTVYSCIYLVTRSYSSRYRLLQVDDCTRGVGFHNLHAQQEINGVISVTESVISTTINGITRITPKHSVVYFCIHMNHQDDMLHFSFT